MRNFWWFIFISLLLVGCAANPDMAPRADQPQRPPSATRSAFFFSQNPNVFFALRIPRVLAIERRSSLPFHFESSDPDVQISFSITVRVPNAKEKTEWAKRSAKADAIGHHLAAIWHQQAVGKGGSAVADCAVVGRDYRLVFKLESPNQTPAQMKKMLREILDTFDPTRLIGGTV